MSTLFGGVALLTRSLGHPISAQALAANTLLNDDGRPDLTSLGEVLRSHGYDNQLSPRALHEIPAPMLPALVITQDGDSLVLAGATHDAQGGRGVARRVG